MTERQDASQDQDRGPDIEELVRRSQAALASFFERQARQGSPDPDPFGISAAFTEATLRLLSDPRKLAEAQIAFWRDHAELWFRTARRMLGQEAEPVVEPPKGDKRFKDPAWNEQAVFDFLKQSYLLSAHHLRAAYGGVEGLEPGTARKVDFFTRQFIDAISPSNFALTNPEVLRRTAETRGENLVRGLQNLLRDLEAGHIRMTDEDAFEVGRNIATTPGKVVYQNELMQLLQYAPSTPEVYRRPLLVVPPWINKFYILDLQPKNSLIRWAVDQGFTVFVVSWVNPDQRHAGKDFEDYMAEGPLAALDAIRRATGEETVNAVGYCLGGTLLAATLAWMAARKDERIASATFLTTLVDFRDAGELSIFVDEHQLAGLERRMEEKGYLDAAAMGATFNALRANDLVWSFVVNNYLLGNDPPPFDLLYWNSDSTRMPAAMHRFYLRRMYQENRLVEPGGIALRGEPIDLRRIEVPTFILSTRDDHIAPWKATYAATRLYRGDITFALAGSGHIAGVVNPPASGKYGYWTNTELPPDPDRWLAGATAREGSWWPGWAEWVGRYGGPRVPARVPGEGGLPALEDAPGSYVKVKAT